VTNNVHSLPPQIDCVYLPAFYLSVHQFARAKFSSGDPASLCNSPSYRKMFSGSSWHCFLGISGISVALCSR